MIISAIHRRYAKALFSLALERNQVDRIAEDLADFNRVLQENKKMHVFLISPEIKSQKKLDLIKEFGQGRFSALFYHFLVLVVKRGRQTFLDGIESEFQRLRELHANVLRATVITTVALNDADKSNILNSLEKAFNAKIKLEARVENTLLGGLQLRIGGKVFDTSIKTRLNRLRENMLRKKE